MTERCPVVHFEMAYDDAGRVAGFYESVFGWKMQKLGAEMGDYILAETTDSDQGRPVAPGQINGGLFPRKPDWPAQSPHVVVGVGDIEAAMKRVRAAGGKVHGTPHDIPNVGLYVACEDCEGNPVCMLQPHMAGEEGA